MCHKIYTILLLIFLFGCNPYGKGTSVDIPTQSNDSETGSGNDESGGGSDSGTPGGGSDSGTPGGGGDYSIFGTGNDGDVTLSSDFFNTNSIPGSTKSWGTTARINNISGNDINLAGGSPNDTTFAVGDEIMWHISTASASCSTDASLYLGAYGFANITNKSGTTLTLDQSITANPDNANIASGSALAPNNGSYCSIQIVRVANFNNLTVDNTVFLKVNPFSLMSGHGGLAVFRIANNLTINPGHTFIVADGFTAGGGGGSGLPPHNGSGDRNIQAPAVNGMGVASCGGLNCDTQFNNGAGGGRGLYDDNLKNHFGGGGGGANIGSGGNGASVGAGTNFGRGGVAPTCAGSNCLFMGSAGGSGSTGGANNGAQGGGVILLFAKNIQGNLIISANGIHASSGYFSGGGGGSGGSAMLQVQNIISGTVSVTALGGNGGVSNGQYGGGGGGGGLATIKLCTGVASVDSSGGSSGSSYQAGDVATAGTVGIATMNLDTTQSFCEP